MDINYLAVFITSVIAMVIGFVWYGPLFGKSWARVIGMDTSRLTPDEKRNMQKRMAPVYLLNFVLSLLTICILAYFIKGWSAVSPIEASLWIWLGFVMPIQAGTAMWSGKPRKLAWEMFLSSSCYQLVVFVVSALILGNWI